MVIQLVSSEGRTETPVVWLQFPCTKLHSHTNMLSVKHCEMHQVETKIVLLVGEGVFTEYMYILFMCILLWISSFLLWRVHFP